MNPLKTQIKIGTLHELGNKFEDVKEVAVKTVAQQEGYGFALDDVDNGIKSVLAKIDEEREAGAYDLEVSSQLKKAVMRVNSVILNLKARQQTHLILAQGQVLGLDLAIKHTKKAFDVEQAKLQGTPEKKPSTAVIEESRPDRANNALADLEERRAQAKAAKTASPPPPDKNVATLVSVVKKKTATPKTPRKGTRKG